MTVSSNMTARLPHLEEMWRTTKVSVKIQNVRPRLRPGKKKKVKSLCSTEHHAMETYWGSGGIAPRILDLGTKWR
jgi:hypothetical protein